jgi:hypothetical protein
MFLVLTAPLPDLNQDGVVNVHDVGLAAWYLPLFVPGCEVNIVVRDVPDSPVSTDRTVSPDPA